MATTETVVVEGADRVVTTTKAPGWGKRAANWLRRMGDRIRQGASWLWNGAKTVGSAVWGATKTAGGWVAGATVSAATWVWSGARTAAVWTFWSTWGFLRATPRVAMRVVGTILRIASWCLMTALGSLTLVGLAIVVIGGLIVLILGWLGHKYEQRVHKHTKAMSRGEYRPDGEGRVRNWLNTRVANWVGEDADEVVPGGVTEPADSPYDNPMAPTTLVEETAPVTETAEAAPSSEEVTVVAPPEESGEEPVVLDPTPGQTMKVQMDSTTVEATAYTAWPIPGLMKVDPKAGSDTGHGPWAIDTASPVVNWPGLELGPGGEKGWKGVEWMASYFNLPYATNEGVGLMMDPPKNVGLKGLQLQTWEEVERHHLTPAQVKVFNLHHDWPNELTGMIRKGRPGLVEQTPEQRFRNYSYWVGRLEALETYRVYIAANPETALLNAKRRWAKLHKDLKGAFDARDLHMGSMKRGWDFQMRWIADMEKKVGKPEAWKDPRPQSGEKAKASA